MTIRTTVAVGLLTLAGSGIVGCSSEKPNAEHVESNEAALIFGGGPHLLWEKKQEFGHPLQLWLMNGATVIGTQDMGLLPNSDGGLPSSLVDTSNNTLVMLGAFGGLEEWSFTTDGVRSPHPTVLSWRCDATCSPPWRPVGMVSFQGQQGLLWHNPSSGEVSFWILSGGTVTGKTIVSWQCGPTCAPSWRALATADFNGDGNSDILWQNKVSGQISVWLLNGQGTVIGGQTLSRSCSDSSGCTSQWAIVDAADVNNDGRADVLWFNAGTGELQNWLLDGNGFVSSTSTLSWTCDAASGCSTEWKPLGYMTKFPLAPPPVHSTTP